MEFFLLLIMGLFVFFYVWRALGKVTAEEKAERERNKPPPDYKKLLAEELLPLAKEGDPEAQWFLGGWYVLGKGIPQDYEVAFKWYNSSAQQGYAKAQFTLGGIYFRGQYSVPQDFVLAHMWLNLASAQGFGEASTIRDKLAEKMTPSQIQEAQRLAREFKPKKENPKMLLKNGAS